MMNFGKQYSQNKTLDGDLMEFVGDYLARNSEKSYIDMDDMIDDLQNKSYRFCRMKKQTFAALVRRAYNRYLQMQHNSDDMNEASPSAADLAKCSAPLQAPSEAAAADDDSDVEIVDSEPDTTPKKPKLTSPTKGSHSEPISESSKLALTSAADKSSGTERNSVITENVPLNEGKRNVRRKAANQNGKSEAPFGNNKDLVRKQKKQYNVIETSAVSFMDFAGADRVVEDICQLLLHLKHPEVYKRLGVIPPRGFLLHGPPGCGKTLLANAIAGEMNLPMLKVAATELISGISGESEGNIRDLFQQALDLAPCIIFLDEIDSITPKRETAQREMERRIVAQLLACIDDLGTKEKGHLVVLIGATNRLETIDSALRRAGRFDREISIGIPDERAREQILRVICKNLRLEPNFEFLQLAKLTPGYVGADLQALAREAAIHAISQILTPQVPGQTNLSPIISGQDSNKLSIANDENALSSGETTQTEGKVQDTTKEISDEKPGTSSAVTSSTGETDEVITLDIDDKSEVLMEVDSSVDPPVVEIDEDNKEDERANAANPIAENDTSKEECAADQLQAPSKWIRNQSPVTEQQLNKMFIEMQHFQLALKHVQPSSKREGFATVPDTTWDDIGALKEIRDELQVSILGPVKYSEAFRSLGICNPAGVLLCGPPGCGKTLLAKAVANEAGINFISVKGPELLNMYVGESERAVRQCFLRARNSAPCVIFFDELDALCPRRSDGADGNSTSRVVNQLLTEMDGIEGRLGVYIMAATNRPDIIDPAVLRPGRLDKILFVDVPSIEDRVDILQTITKKGTKPRLDDDVNISEVAGDPHCSNFTGADLTALIREASVAAFRELVLKPHLNSSPIPPLSELKVSKRHFEAAYLKIKPSVSQKDLAKYEVMKKLYTNVVKQEPTAP